MASRDKVEPFWARPVRSKRRAQPPPLVVPPRTPDAAPAPPATPADASEPHEPTFTISSQARRDTIAALIAGGPAPAETAAVAPGPKFSRDAPAEPPPGPIFGRAPPEETPPSAVGGWTHLSAAQAAQHPLYGVRGWLVAIAVLVALGLFRAVVELIDFWATTDHGGLAAWIMAILRSGMALWGALILGLLLGRSRAFPANFAAYGMVNVLYLMLFGLAFAHVTQGRVFAGVAAAIAVTLIATAYVLRSRRVNVTYRRRVRAKHGAPAAAPAPG